MKPSVKRLAAAAGAAALAGALLVTGNASAEPDSEPAQAIDWQPCPELEPGQVVDCATIEVPLDYTQPDGEQIEIGLARRQATNPDEKIGTILMDPGGPGGSGVSAVMSGNPVTDAVAERFDVVGFDPRGVNTSTQVLCGAEAVEAVTSLGIPTDQASFDARLEANAALTEDCRERTGPLFDHVDNLHTVEDMERIRLALGEEKLDYLGYSYGTLMGQQYAETYPENIRTMVLDGNMDHSLASTWDFMATETAPVEENFLAFAEWCTGAAECALNGEDIPALYGELKDRARAGTLTDPFTGEPLDFYGLADYGNRSNSPEYWTDLGTLLVAMRDGTTVPPTASMRQEEPVEDPYYPMWCQDWGFQIADFAEFEELTGKLAAEYPNIEWSTYNQHALTCAGSGIETTNPRAELEIEGAPPLMFIGNLHDYATVYPWSVTSAEQAGGHLVTYEGYMHTVYSGKSDCIDEAVDAYYLDLTVPDEGLSCPSVDVPGAPAPDPSGREAPVAPF